MFLDNEEPFERTEDPFADAEALSNEYKLGGAYELASVLMWVDERNYDPVPQARSGGELRRPHASELHGHLRSAAAGCGDAYNFELMAFDGIVSLACVDRYGVDLYSKAVAAVGDLYLLPVRSEPLDAGGALADLIVRPLAAHWHLYRSGDDAFGFADFATDALRGRWNFPEGVLPKAVERAAKRWGLA